MKSPLPSDDAIDRQTNGPMRTIGNLKLPEEHIARFRAALEHYEIESIGSFLRRCAYLITRHAEAGEVIEQPWSLRTVKADKSAKRKKKAARKQE